MYCIIQVNYSNKKVELCHKIIKKKNYTHVKYYITTPRYTKIIIDIIFYYNNMKF